ncbi:hypothetical protein mRhiFer1_009318 [Rhinolophus ferrumequinum]|uniref:Uncharacterized protein n=1 Tax=Rhinolophus ferrumequinum TaxID=59479 RepID=A0A7J7RXT6_RHIFE|nr:hypothetical protein mRhiFer1_009318 [Rhinolophus ferrumequinum]
MTPKKEHTGQGDGDPGSLSCLRSAFPFYCTPTQGFPTGVSPWQSSGPRVHFSDLYNFQRISINLPHPRDEWQLEAKCFPAKARNESFPFFLCVSLPLPFAGELNVLSLEGLREAGAGSNAILPT